MTDTRVVVTRKADAERGADELEWALNHPKRSWALFIVLVALTLAGVGLLLLVDLSREMVGLVSVLLMILFIFLRTPVGVAMIVPSVLGLYSLLGENVVIGLFKNLAYAEIASWTLSVIPMFVVMGILLWKAGLTHSLYVAGRQWLGWMPGGLAVGTNVAGTGLAAVSGSTVGTTYALARIGIPEMLRAGYDKRLAIGSVLVAGLPGQLIPPSILLVVFAGIAEVPVGPQLLAGILPGIFVSIMFSLMLVIFAKKWAPKVDPSTSEIISWADRFRSLAKVWPVPVIILIIAGGMFSGIFTATEAGAVAALAAVIITFIWRRGQRPWTAIREASITSISSIGAIFFMLVGVGALSRLLSITGISQIFADWVEAISLPAYAFLLLMLVVYIILGMFMEPLPMMLLTVPILMPTLETLDISLLWFGVFVVFMGELAILTPPVGILAFIVHGITREPEVNQGQRITMSDVFGAVWWFFPMAIIVVIALIFLPEIATWLPNLASGTTQ